MRTNDPSNYGCGYVQLGSGSITAGRGGSVDVRVRGGEREDLGKSTYNNRSEEWRPLDRWKMVNVIDWRGISRVPRRQPE